MTERIAVDLGNVQKTLLLPLWGRAVESKKARPWLVDRTAQAIVEKLDYDFDSLARHLSPLTQKAWIMRSVYVDQVAKSFLTAHPRGTVVNIGCGLDTTFDRVDNGELIWYDLDLPDTIGLRKQLISESERRHFISASFLEEGWLKDIQAGAGILFIAAGVFYYFEAPEIKAFLIRLADRFPGAEIVFDVCSPLGMKIANRAVIQNSGLDERSFLKWGTSGPPEIAAWDPRLRILNTYLYFGDKAKSMPWRLRMIGRLSDILQVQYMVHLGVKQ